jgi:2-desacetyl-2-hydroxyethyl bacteriochlorophyllide A dehydrogenase
MDNMNSQAIIITEPLQAKLQATSQQPPGARQIQIKTLYSLVSPGTELAIYQGMESWAPLPFNLGYAAVGKVTAIGPDVTGYEIGEIVVAYTAHREISNVDLDSNYNVTVKLPESGNLPELLFIRLAAVAITALRVSPPELGDIVVVYGMGAIGNLAAQLYQLAGARVIGIDLAQHRLEQARACGITETINPACGDVLEQLLALTGGVKANVIVEATGVPAVAAQAPQLGGPRSELVLLGSPRGEYQCNLTKFLNYSHLWDHGCVTVKGALEWRYPTRPEGGCKHSLTRNCNILKDLIQSGRLKIKPLLTHLVSPAQCQDVYQGLMHRKDEYTTVIFDWTKI